MPSSQNGSHKVQIRAVLSSPNISQKRQTHPRHQQGPLPGAHPRNPFQHSAHIVDVPGQCSPYWVCLSSKLDSSLHIRNGCVHVLFPRCLVLSFCLWLVQSHHCSHCTPAHQKQSIISICKAPSSAHILCSGCISANRHHLSHYGSCFLDKSRHWIASNNKRSITELHGTRKRHHWVVSNQKKCIKQEKMHQTH